MNVTNQMVQRRIRQPTQLTKDKKVNPDTFARMSRLCVFINYSIWESTEHLRRAFNNPELQSGLKDIQQAPCFVKLMNARFSCLKDLTCGGSLKKPHKMANDLIEIVCRPN